MTINDFCWIVNGFCLVQYFLWKVNPSPMNFIGIDGKWKNI